MAELQMASVTSAASHPSSDDKHEKLLQTLTEISRESTQKVRLSAPTVKAVNAKGLREELKLLKRYFNEAKIVDRRQWFKLV